MQLRSLQISNILSFKHYEDINCAPLIEFNSGLNIFIGENGAGKSTVVGVLNFIFKKVLFIKCSFEWNEYHNTLSELAENKKNLIRPNWMQGAFVSSHLPPHWDHKTQEQQVKLKLLLDETDKANIDNLLKYQIPLQKTAERYTREALNITSAFSKELTITLVQESRESGAVTIDVSPNNDDFGYLYLKKYNLFKQLIALFNFENPKNTIPELYETLTLMGPYRNYSSFQSVIALNSKNAAQVQLSRQEEALYVKDSRSVENMEPVIFSTIGYQMADVHFTNYNALKPHLALQRANQLPWVEKINGVLEILGLRLEIVLKDVSTWTYSFIFYYKDRSVDPVQFEYLSAGQKAMLHLTLEVYGRGMLKGGLFIIDEPEIHLHYQYQKAYLKILGEFTKEHQFLLVTHSEGLINSDTIASVNRFFLSTQDASTQVVKPAVTIRNKWLVKLLDYTKSTHAFFAKKIILVEGETDRYFFQCVLNILYPSDAVDFAILNIGGKNQRTEWQSFFEDIGLKVYYIGDLDDIKEFGIITELEYAKILSKNVDAYVKKLWKRLKEKETKDAKLLMRSIYDMLSEWENGLLTEDTIRDFKFFYIQLLRYNIPFSVVKSSFITRKTIKEINSKYSDGVFILKRGDLEQYTEVGKDLTSVMQLCDDAHFIEWIKHGKAASELRNIFKRITD